MSDTRRSVPLRRRALLFALLLASASAAHALRCGNGIVAVGDPALRLSQVCGTPTQVEHFTDTKPTRYYDERLGAYVIEDRDVPYEIWTYNFGPRRFLMRITVRAGNIVSIDSQGYGY